MQKVIIIFLLSLTYYRITKWLNEVLILIIIIDKIYVLILGILELLLDQPSNPKVKEKSEASKALVLKKKAKFEEEESKEQESNFSFPETKWSSFFLDAWDIKEILSFLKAYILSGRPIMDQLHKIKAFYPSKYKTNKKHIDCLRLFWHAVMTVRGGFPFTVNVTFSDKCELAKLRGSPKAYVTKAKLKITPTGQQ